jgi:TIR domain
LTTEVQTENGPKDFFISYAGADRDWAKWIASCLEQAGHSVLIYDWDFPIGSNFIYGMDNALKRAKRVVAVLSPDYLASQYTFPEWAGAFRRDPQGKVGLLLPVRVQSCEVSGLLGAIAFCDLIACDEQIARERLLAAARGIQPHPTTTPFPGGSPPIIDTEQPSSSKPPLFLAKQKECMTFYRLCAKRWLQIPVWLATSLCAISILLSFNFLPQNVPPISFLKQHLFVMLILGLVLMLITFTSLIILYFSQRKESDKASIPNLRRYNQYIVTISTTSIISFLLCSTLLVAAFFQLPWCLATLCPPSQILTKVQDANLEMYFLALQSTSFVIPRDPVNYSRNELPENIGAVRIDKQAPSSLYRVVIGVHSLEKGVYSILIEQVTLVIEQVIPMPRPLNVWLKGSPVVYQANPYQASYDRENAGGTLSAVYTPVPYAHVQLAPDEADQLDIQVTSHVLVDFRFHIQLTYRLSQQSVLHTLTLPDTFEVVFSDTSNWNEYYLQKGHFVLKP